MMISNLPDTLSNPLVMAKLNMAYLSSLKNEQNCCRPTCRCHHLGYSVPLAYHRTIWCRSTFWLRGPGLSNPTSSLRPALPIAPSRDDNARDKRSVLRPNPATFLRDFTLNMTTNYANIRKSCLDYNVLYSPSVPSVRYNKERDDNAKDKQIYMYIIIIITSGTNGLNEKSRFHKVPYLKTSAPSAALWWFQTQQRHLPSRLSWLNWTRHICEVQKMSKTAVVLHAGVNISGTPCPRHITVLFGAEAPSDHVVQAWAIPPPSWGLFSKWHRRETTTPETNEASSVRTQRHS